MWRFMRVRKKFWMLPIFVVMLVLGIVSTLIAVLIRWIVYMVTGS